MKMLASTLLPLLILLASPISSAPLTGTQNKVRIVKRQASNDRCSATGNIQGNYHGHGHHSHHGKGSASASVSAGSAVVTTSTTSSQETSTTTTQVVVSTTTTESVSSTSSAAAGPIDQGVQNAAVTASTSPATTANPSPAPSSSATQAASVTGGNLSEEDSTMLNLHNDFRKKYGADPLMWNSDLAKFAKDYASGCKFEHSGGPYGENLAAGAGGGWTPTSGFESWANEAQQYDFNNPGFASNTGHFTAVVWKGTTEVGCATVQCPDNTIFSGYGTSSYLVCEYQKAGNIVGQDGPEKWKYFVQNVGPYVG